MGSNCKQQEDIRRLKQECDKLKGTRSDYSKKSQELQLKIEVTGKALKELIGQKQVSYF